MTIHEARQHVLFQLYHLYDDREAAAITDLVMENITGWKKIDRILNKQVPLSMPQEALLKKYTAELLSHTPVQYVLHEAWFYGMKLHVDEQVLIPRPETEELVKWVIEDSTTAGKVDIPHAGAVRILDIGTGSGSIPIALKKNIPRAEIYSCDVSESALQIANRNAIAQQVNIHLLLLDFLHPHERNKLPYFDIIISNPPYIPLREKETMRPNVVHFEPHLALFVNDDDPLVFYNAIADFARERLHPNGSIYVEIHEEHAAAVDDLFLLSGFKVDTKKDMQGKDRMKKATMLP